MLNAHQERVNPPRGAGNNQRDRLVASYTMLAAVGRLAPSVFGLHVPVYDAKVHCQQMRDNLAGVCTPDGR